MNDLMMESVTIYSCLIFNDLQALGVPVALKLQKQTRSTAAKAGYTSTSSLYKIVVSYIILEIG